MTQDSRCDILRFGYQMLVKELLVLYCIWGTQVKDWVNEWMATLLESSEGYLFHLKRTTKIYYKLTMWVCLQGIDFYNNFLTQVIMAKQKK